MIVRRQMMGFIWVIIIFVLLLGEGVGLGYVWWQERGKRLQAEQTAQDARSDYYTVRAECDAVRYGANQSAALGGTKPAPAIAAVEAQADAPRCERPTLQPFTEAMRAQDVKFFEKVKDGDVLVIYPLSKKVYVYRQSTSEIIIEAKIADPAQANQSKQSDENSAMPTIQGFSP